MAIWLEFKAKAKTKTQEVLEVLPKRSISCSQGNQRKLGEADCSRQGKEEKQMQKYQSKTVQGKRDNNMCVSIYLEWRVYAT